MDDDTKAQAWGAGIFLFIGAFVVAFLYTTDEGAAFRVAHPLLSWVLVVVAALAVLSAMEGVVKFVVRIAKMLLSLLVVSAICVSGYLIVSDEGWPSSPAEYVRYVHDIKRMTWDGEPR